MENYINLVFVVDESGSMYSSISDVIGGFKRIVDEQKQVKDGKCTISLYTFANEVNEVYLGKDVNEINKIVYNPGGCTAMNDGIGVAIDKIGNWLSEMKEEDRPSKTLVVIMTDGYENASKKYSSSKVKEMIKHQTEKYSWDFMYVGADITTTETAKDLGISNSRMSMSSRSNLGNSYAMLSKAATLYRCADASCADATMDSYLTTTSINTTNEYENELGIKLT